MWDWSIHSPFLRWAVKYSDGVSFSALHQNILRSLKDWSGRGDGGILHDYFKRSREQDKYGGHQNPLGACIVNVCWRTFRFLGFYRKAVVMIVFFFLFPFYFSWPFYQSYQGQVMLLVILTAVDRLAQAISLKTNASDCILPRHEIRIITSIGES